MFEIPMQAESPWAYDNDRWVYSKGFEGRMVKMLQESHDAVGRQKEQMSGKLTNYMLMIAAEKMDAQSTPDAVGVMEVTEILRVTVLDYLPGKRKETDIFPICDPPGDLGYKETTLTGVINKSEKGKTRRALTKEYMWDMCAVMRDIVRVIVDRLEACVDRHINEGSQFPSMMVRKVIEKVRQHLAWQTTEIRQGPTNKDSNLPNIIETYQGYGKATEISELTASQIDPGLVDLHSLVVQWAHSSVLVHFKDTEIAVNMAFLHNLVSRFLGALRDALDIQGDVLGQEDVHHLHVQFHEGTISQMGGKEYAELNLKDGTFQKGEKRIKKTGIVLISIVPDRLSGTTMNALQDVKKRMDAQRGMFFPGQLQQLLDSVWLLLPAGYHWTFGTKMGVPTVKMWVEIYVILWKIHETALTTEKVFLPYVLWTANTNQTFLPQIIRPTMLGLPDAAPGGEYYDSGEYYEYYDRQATYAKMDAEKGEKRKTQKEGADERATKKRAVSPVEGAQRVSTLPCLSEVYNQTYLPPMHPATPWTIPPATMQNPGTPAFHFPSTPATDMAGQGGGWQGDSGDQDDQGSGLFDTNDGIGFGRDGSAYHAMPLDSGNSADAWCRYQEGGPSGGISERQEAGPSGARAMREESRAPMHGHGPPAAGGQGCTDVRINLPALGFCGPPAAGGQGCTDVRINLPALGGCGQSGAVARPEEDATPIPQTRSMSAQVPRWRVYAHGHLYESMQAFRSIVARHTPCSDMPIRRNVSTEQNRIIDQTYKAIVGPYVVVRRRKAMETALVQNIARIFQDFTGLANHRHRNQNVWCAQAVSIVVHEHLRWVQSPRAKGLAHRLTGDDRSGAMELIIAAAQILVAMYGTNQDCVSFNEQVMDHKQATGFSRRLLSARVLAYVRHLEDKKEPKCRPCAATLLAAKQSYSQELSDNWGKGQGSQFLKEYCWAFLDALADRLLQAESERAQQGMGEMPADGSRLSTTQVANAIQLGALVMKRKVRPRDGDLECNAEATRVLYDGIQTLIEDQDQMDPEDVQYQCVGFLRTMGIWLEDEAFAREDMDFINRELFPALGRVDIREAPGRATAGGATQNTPPSGRTLLRDLRKDFCEMMNVRMRRTGIFSSVHEVSQDWKHFLQGCHVEVKSVVIELSTQRSPQLKLELVVKQNAAEDLTKAPHSEGASLALQAFYTDAQAYWSVTEDEDKSRCKAVKDWFSLSLLPALIRVMDDMACCAEPLGTAEGLGATLGLAKQGSAMITRTRERIGTKILWEEGVSWERNVLDTEMTEDVTVMKKVVACLKTLQIRTEEHDPTRYHMKIEAQVLGKKDSSWNGGWRFKMVSEGRGMGTGVQELPVMARNENPVEECIEAQEEQTNAESGKEDAADDPDFREGDESEDEDWDESDGST